MLGQRGKQQQLVAMSIQSQQLQLIASSHVSLVIATQPRRHYHVAAWQFDGDADKKKATPRLSATPFHAFATHVPTPTTASASASTSSTTQGTGTSRDIPRSVRGTSQCRRNHVGDSQRLFHSRHLFWLCSRSLLHFGCPIYYLSNLSCGQPPGTSITLLKWRRKTVRTAVGIGIGCHVWKSHNDPSRDCELWESQSVAVQQHSPPQPLLTTNRATFGLLYCRFVLVIHVYIYTLAVSNPYPQSACLTIKVYVSRLSYMSKSRWHQVPSRSSRVSWPCIFARMKV